MTRFLHLVIPRRRCALVAVGCIGCWIRWANFEYSISQQVRLPEDVNIQHVIDITAKYVLQDGCKFEQYIMEQASYPALSHRTRAM